VSEDDLDFAKYEKEGVGLTALCNRRSQPFPGSHDRGPDHQLYVSVGSGPLRGQFFGEGCLNGHPLRIATTTAMEECVITSITKEAMIATLHAERKFSELFTAYLLTRNSRVEEDLIDQLFNSARNDSHAFFFCWRISEKNAHLSLFQ
jgi:hypothetical protein